ncbi:hypothetical protein IWQ60_005645, partial [Tieghemiomyces parasiticus]
MANAMGSPGLKSIIPAFHSKTQETNASLESKDNISAFKLPNDVMFDVVDMLPPDDRKQFGFVSRQFHEVSQEVKRHNLQKILRSIRDDLDNVSLVDDVKHTSSKLTAAKNKVRAAESEVEEAQRAVEQASGVFNELNDEYHKALEDLIDAQEAISTKDRVAPQNSINSELAKLSELRQNMRTAKEALANPERQYSEAQNNLKRQITDLERANDEHAKCLEIYRPLFVAFTGHTSRLAIIFRPFSQAWLLNEARLLKGPPLISKLDPYYADGQETDQYDEDILKDRRWHDLRYLRRDIQKYLKSGLSMTTAKLTTTEPSEGTSTGLLPLLLGKPPTLRVTPRDLLRSPYSSIYELIALLDDDRLGLLIRQVLGEPSASFTISQYTDDKNTLLGITDMRYFRGHHDRDGNGFYWARDLTVALVTLRFLHNPTAIDPESQLYKTLSDHELALQIVRVHIWAIGTELGIPDVDFLVTD